jgi:hypothetical protein
VRGPGRHPRPPWLCARLLAVLVELRQAVLEIGAGDARCGLVDGAPAAALERSATYVAFQRELERARSACSAELSELARPRAAAAG